MATMSDPLADDMLDLDLLEYNLAFDLGELGEDQSECGWPEKVTRLIAELRAERTARTAAEAERDDHAAEFTDMRDGAGRFAGEGYFEMKARLAAVVALCDAEEAQHECDFPYSHTRHDLHVATFRVRAIASALGLETP